MPAWLLKVKIFQLTTIANEYYNSVFCKKNFLQNFYYNDPGRHFSLYSNIHGKTV